MSLHGAWSELRAWSSGDAGPDAARALGRLEALAAGTPSEARAAIALRAWWAPGAARSMELLAGIAGHDPDPGADPAAIRGARVLRDADRAYLARAAADGLGFGA